ncbi:MAG: bifunctional metallophosphatase/5'-nucleotidase, partial [Firmicutes bacterium]|nr:bifunctional metallophosphatase/5'-nucleotidase [Bacillota bacterium]
MKKILAVWLSLVMFLSFAAPVMAENTELSDDIVILYTNDVHTYIDGVLSYDVIAAIKDDLETQYEHVLLLDAGDHIQGTA